MERIGFVKRVEDGKMELELRRASGWGSNCKECSSSCEVAPHSVVVSNSLDAKVGDFVEVQAEVSNLLKYTFILYMIPFMFLIAGIFIGNFLFRNLNIDSREMLSFLSGLVAVAISLLILKFMDKKAENRDDGTIKATKIL